MAIQIQADEISEIIRNQTRDYERNLLPLCNLSNLCISGTDTNDRMARTSKMNIILACGFRTRGMCLFACLLTPYKNCLYASSKSLLSS